MDKVMQAKTFQATWPARLLLVLIYFAGITLLWNYTPFGIPAKHKNIVVFSYAILGVLWLTDICSRRIVIRNKSLDIFSLADFQIRCFSRDQIEAVTWERPGRVLIKLKTGRWIKLPHVWENPKGLTNTIRAWLKRTDDGEEGAL
jgi:hypothetical protein